MLHRVRAGRSAAAGEPGLGTVRYRPSVPREKHDRPPPRRTRTSSVCSCPATCAESGFDSSEQLAIHPKHRTSAGVADFAGVPVTPTCKMYSAPTSRRSVVSEVLISRGGSHGRCAGLPTSGGFGSGSVADGRARRSSRRPQIFFNQHRRHGERFADVVEAEARIVGREILSAGKSTPSRSRIVLVYSLRFRRCATTRPGSGLTSASALSNSPVTKVHQTVDIAAGGFGMPFGGISPPQVFAESFPTARDSSAIPGSEKASDSGRLRPVDHCDNRRRYSPESASPLYRNQAHRPQTRQYQPTAGKRRQFQNQATSYQYQDSR